MAGLNILKKTAGARPHVSQRRIKSLTLKAIKLLGLGRWQVDLVFVDDRLMRQLNRDYHKSDCPTDVLAFDYGERLADIIISLDTARRNSRLYQTSFQDELLLYIIHGILHLAGYSDLTQKGRKEMFKKQQWLFSRLKRLS